MRLELLYNPRLLCERLAELSIERRRLAKLRGTVAGQLTTGHIDSLELLELVRPQNPQVIYDVGANVGTWTLLAKALYPQVQVHAFEPLPMHAEKFRQLTAGLKGVHLHEIGLGPRQAQAVIKVTDFSDASSLLKLNEEGKRLFRLNQIGETPIQIQRLDDWVVRHHLPSPDLIKLDIQGYELEALRGGEISLRSANAVLTEVSFVELYQDQCLIDELAGYLRPHGFHLYAFGAKTELGKPLLQTDALFIKKSVRSKLD